MMEALIGILAQATIVISLPAAILFLILFLKELRGTGNGILFALRMQTGVMLFFLLATFFISIYGTIVGYGDVTRALAYIRTIVLIIVQAWVAIIYSNVKE